MQFKGAEAVLTINKPAGAIVKTRVVKKYRLPQLDVKIRLPRTKLEAKLLHKAKLAGVRCPLVKDVNLQAAEITQQYLDGKNLSTVELNADIAKQAGEQLALLHKAGIVHGDSTTSNFLIDNTGSVWVFDFGLAKQSTELEDQAIDLILFKNSTTLSPALFKQFAKGYSLISGEPFYKQLESKMKEVLSRARYVQRGG